MQIRRRKWVQVDVTGTVYVVSIGGRLQTFGGWGGGTKQIEAIQLTMGLGTVKIPVIPFTIEPEFNPSPITLNFTADLFDGDADDHQHPFSVDLDVATA